MTEPTLPEIVEPKSLPDNLPPPGAFGQPNALEAASSRRTSLIVWGLIGLIFVGGIAAMALTWRDAALPTFGDWSFDAPQIENPFDDVGAPRADGNVMSRDPAPEGMSISETGDANAVGQSDKSPGE